jgi:hypothetical protein
LAQPADAGHRAAVLNRGQIRGQKSEISLANEKLKKGRKIENGTKLKKGN